MAGPNVGLAVFASFVLAVGIALLWRPGEPPILLLLFLLQWLQAAAGLFYGNLTGRSVGLLSGIHGNHEKAISLMLTGLLVLAIAIRLAAGPNVRALLPRIQAFVGAQPLQFWVWLFIVTWVFGALCDSASIISGGLRQVLLSLSGLKWAAFVLLTLASFAVPNRSKIPWLLVFGWQFALSIGGFFSTFKDVFLYALIGLVASNVRLRARVLLPAGILVSMLLFLALVWTAIKTQYRDFASRRTGGQVVLISYADRVTEVRHLVSNLSREDLSAATDLFIDRLMYFDFFGLVLDRVPGALPHSDGQIWLDAFRRPFMPRILFSNKTAVDDTELTSRYTGFKFSTTSRETSVSMGYMAEAYIDFGSVNMFIPIACLGLIIGALYRWLLSRRGLDAVIGSALAPFALMPAILSETSALKLVPSLGLSVISCWLVLKFVAPRVFHLPGRSKQFKNPSRVRISNA